MARIRTIKPEFFTSEDIVSLSPLARLLYIALWCEADKEGRMVWKPVTFKLRYLPGDNCDVLTLCKELTDAGLVVLYGNGYAHIPAFQCHQHINPRETASQLPEPDASVTRRSSVGTRQPRVGTGANLDMHVQGGREGKGKEGTTTRVDVVDDGFDLFYQAYPKKVGKPAAQKAFKSAKVNGNLSAILADIESKKSSDAWTKDGGQFIPNPATYLNQRRWEDETQADQPNIFAGAI